MTLRYAFPPSPIARLLHIPKATVLTLRRSSWLSTQSGRRWKRRHFPSRQVANKQLSFILLPASADKRSGGVSGALRGGQERGGDTLPILLVFERQTDAAASRRGPKEENINPSAPVPEATLAKTSATRCLSPGSSPRAPGLRLAQALALYNEKRSADLFGRSAACSKGLKLSGGACFGGSASEPRGHGSADPLVGAGLVPAHRAADMSAPCGRPRGAPLRPVAGDGHAQKRSADLFGRSAACSKGLKLSGGACFGGSARHRARSQHLGLAAARVAPRKWRAHARQNVAQGSLTSLAGFRCHSWKNRGPHEQVRATRACFPVAPTGISPGVAPSPSLPGSAAGPESGSCATFLAAGHRHPPFGGCDLVRPALLPPRLQEPCPREPEMRIVFDTNLLVRANPK